MGAQIAAHLANAGIPVRLLDLTKEAAAAGADRLRSLKPDPFFTRDAATLLSFGSFDADLPTVAGADLIIEAVVEQLDIKRSLLERVDAVRKGDTIVASNTSGIPLAALAAGRSEGFRRHWLGTHFFNPPRYLRLLEIIPTADTDAGVIDRISRFADYHLGKGVVIAKDHPNFIANHIGIYSAVEALRVLEAGEFTIEEIDAMTGPVLGRPKSATFRTIDIAGVDVLAAVAGNLDLEVPSVVTRLIERGWLGEKSGQGFYRRQKVESRGDGASEILTLDPASFTFRPREAPRLPAVDAVRSVDDVRARTRALFLDQGRTGAFLRRTLGRTLLHTAGVADQIAYSRDDIDRAMRWGYGWELGPFEIWDAIGVADAVDAMRQAGLVNDNDLPPAVVEILRSGGQRFRDAPLQPAAPDLQILKAARDRSRLVRSNTSASLVDLGDGVLAVEFHSKMNAIGGDTLEIMRAGVAEATRNFTALVVGNEGVNFSAGANLMLLLVEAQDGNWDEIDAMIRAFQGATTMLRYAAVPVVVASAGLTLGGGCEVLLHADRVQAAAESYIGLVEAGVGLIPAGGGTKELLARATSRLTPGVDALPFVRQTFETIGFARVSTSAADARRLGLLREHDRITANVERLIYDAKELALDLARGGYHPPVPSAIAVGGESVLAALKLGIHLASRAGHITDHDVTVATALAFVLAGGSLPHASAVSEQYLLDLEREAFLKLCGERKTLERIQYTLKTGKTLRN